MLDLKKCKGNNNAVLKLLVKCLNIKGQIIAVANNGVSSGCNSKNQIRHPIYNSRFYHPGQMK